MHRHETGHTRFPMSRNFPQSRHSLYHSPSSVFRRAHQCSTTVIAGDCLILCDGLLRVESTAAPGVETSRRRQLVETAEYGFRLHARFGLERGGVRTVDGFATRIKG